MKRVKIVCETVLIFGILCLLFSSLARATIPKYVNFQGRLTDADGSPVADDTYSVTFRLYDSETGGTALWTETQSATVANGVFNAALGTETALDLLFNDQYWLSLQIGSDLEMTPRQRLTAAGYAINADNLDTYTSGQFLRSDSNDSASGQITLTYPGAALVVQPSSALTANTKLINVKDTSGSSKFSVDYEGDMISQDATVAGGMRIGTGSTPDDITALADDSLFVEGNVEVDGAIYFDGTVDFDGNVDFTGVTVTGLTGADVSHSLDDAYDDGQSITVDDSGDLVFNLADDEDFVVQDATTVAFRVEDSGLVAVVNGAYSTPDTATAIGDLFVEDALEVDGSADIDTDLDVDGTANLDAVDIDGAVQIDNTVTVGVNDTGYDVKFFGTTSGAYLLWDESLDDLELVSADLNLNNNNIVTDAATIASTELDLLDGLSGTIWTSANDGTGSTLDADLLDGNDSSAFLTASPFGAFIDDTELTAEDFGDFTSTGLEDGCTLDANSVDDSEIVDALTYTGTLTVGSDGWSANDVKFFGTTTGKYLLWDGSGDDLIVNGDTRLGGTSAPTVALDVTGEQKITGSAGAAGVTAADVLTVAGGAGGASSTAAGGAGSDLVVTTGAGGQSTYDHANGDGGAGGGMSFTTGAGGMQAWGSVLGSGGTGGDFVVTTGVGGALGNPAGAGGDFTLTAGAGGEAYIETGGTGGSFTLTAGAGGTVYGWGVDVSDPPGGGQLGTGGSGGAITLSAGAGGNGDADSSGVGGALTLTTGAGGDGIYTTAGAGGDFTLTTGVGGDGQTGYGQAGGAGGDIYLTTGAGGTGDSVGSYGNIILDSQNKVVIGDGAANVDFVLEFDGESDDCTITYDEDNNILNYGDSDLTTTGTISGNQLVATVADGTTPMTITSTTVVANLNADQVDGSDASDFAAASHTHNYITDNADDSMAGDLTLDDDDTGTALTVRADAADSGATVGVLITTDDNNSANYTPLEIRHDSGGNNVRLVSIDQAGSATFTGNLKVGSLGLGSFAVGGILQQAYNAISDGGGGKSQANVASDDDLYIEGSLEIDGTTYHDGGSDLAENYLTTEPVEAGDVVIVDENSNIRLRKSYEAYDIRVAGVISTQPGMVLGSREGEPLSLAGRVPCRVDASFGTIKPGDLLTTSPVPGYAMKAAPIYIDGDGKEVYRAGTILGKALEPLNEGKRKIEVLVALQ